MSHATPHETSPHMRKPVSRPSGEREGMKKQGVITIIASLVFLVGAVVLWGWRRPLAFGAAIIFLAWGLHGVVRGCMFLWESRAHED